MYCVLHLYPVCSSMYMTLMYSKYACTVVYMYVSNCVKCVLVQVSSEELIALSRGVCANGIKVYTTLHHSASPYAA